MLISNREPGILAPYSLQVTRIVFGLAGIKRVATTEEYILVFRPAAICVLELRGPDLNAGVVPNKDRKVLAVSH